MTRTIQRQASIRSVPSEPLETVHRPPTPKPRSGVKDRQYADAFERISLDPRILEGLIDSMRALDERRNTLRSGKGRWLVERRSVFDVPNLWIDGYLGLRVDEQHGEVRRRGYDKCISFVIPSLQWTVFLAAWNGGQQGCSARLWERRNSMLKDKEREKATRRKVTDRLRALGIRLECRRPPRLVEITKTLK